jgi:hypothetical protein
VDRTYAEEMATLPATHAAWVDWRAGAPRRRALPDGPVLAIASGASLAVAERVATLIAQRWRRPAIVTTPLELVARPVPAGLALVISDSFGHPDAAEALCLATRIAAETVALTNRTADEVRERVDASRVDAGQVEVVTCPRPGRDGWIATNSVLSLSLGATTYLDADDGMAPVWRHWERRWLTEDLLLQERHDLRHDSLLCLHAPGLRSVAVDVEARLAESGFGAPTVAELRGLSHGRHVGLTRRAGATAVLLVGSPPWQRLAEMSLAALPEEVPARLWAAESPPPWDAIELLVPSFGLLARRAHAHGADPGNPAVRPSGQALFRLPLADYLPDGAG